MAKKKRKNKSPEELNTENELIKLKLMAEFGGDFVGGEKVPPGYRKPGISCEANHAVPPKARPVENDHGL